MENVPVPSFALGAPLDGSLEAEVPLRMQHLFVMRHGDRLDDAVRHGEPIDGAVPEWIPWDPPLTGSGKRRARKLGRRLRQEGWNITRVVCSPFLRCVQTACEVIISLCALDTSEDGCLGLAVPIDPSKVKVSIEYGLCEVMNSYAIRAPSVPSGGPTVLDLKDIEALFPANTVDTTVPRFMTELPKWGETLDASHKRYVDTFFNIANMFPHENVLCVTHGEGVGVAVSRFEPVMVSQVQYCAISHLQRPIFSSACPPSEPFELLTKSGDDSGIHFSWILRAP